MTLAQLKAECKRCEFVLNATHSEIEDLQKQEKRLRAEHAKATRALFAEMERRLQNNYVDI